MIRAVQGDADLDLCARICRAVEDVAPSAEQLRAVQDRLLLDPDGGYAYVNHSSVVGSAYAMVRVLPERRGAGIGSALVEAAASAAREFGHGSAWGYVCAGDEDSLRFASTRGFAEVGRDVELTRRLVPGEGAVPAGIIELQDEHRVGAYAVSVACMPDMPTAGVAAAGPFETWVEKELADAVAAFVALERGAVVGYATFQPTGDPRRLEHGFTGVLPEHRRRGFATALGRAQLAWAAKRGYEELVTTTGVSNTGLRRQKAKLGYVERDGPILVRGAV
ncbi:MAG: GNAT family N-acetyltransferase [Gaiellaceae bacterium]